MKLLVSNSYELPISNSIELEITFGSRVHQGEEVVRKFLPSTYLEDNRLLSYIEFINHCIKIDSSDTSHIYSREDLIIRYGYPKRIRDVQRFLDIDVDLKHYSYYNLKYLFRNLDTNYLGKNDDLRKLYLRVNYLNFSNFTKSKRLVFNYFKSLRMYYYDAIGAKRTITISGNIHEISM